MAIKLVTLPPTEFGAKLAINSDEDFRVVYRPSERNPDFYIYHELWYPDEDYPDGYIAVPLNSVFGGTQTFAKDTVFANVEGSSRDPKPINPNDPQKKRYDSWRKLMKDKISNYTTCCAEKDTVYNSSTQQRDTRFICTNEGKEDYSEGIYMQGAHVLMNETASRKPPEGSTVYMLPLCLNHNIFDKITGHYGTGYYMKLRRAQEVIILNGFIPTLTIQNAISQEEQNMKNVQLTEKPQLSVGLEFTFMGVDLGAYYTKKPSGYQIFVAPMNVDNRAEVSLSEMIEQFNQLAGAGSLSEDNVKKKIKTEENSDTAANINWGSIKFCLKMLFLNIDSEADVKTTEYALSLQIIADGLIPKDITVFNVKSLSFNIWNTQRQNVLDKMALTTPESF